VSVTASPSSPTPWWHNAVVYQLYVRSFADSNGDGIGDLDGIRSKLDYLQQLGVDAVWLTPCFPSPQYDHGYDVADYFSIDPDYGSVAVFDELVSEARRHGIKILMDVVPNHCSTDHAWFQAALRAAPGSPERAPFYFRDGRGVDGSEPPNNWRAWFGGPAWSRIVEPDGTPGQWYLHVFTPWQPDFNWTNDDVIEHFHQMLTFWFDHGVEGFRVDAVAVVGKAPGLPDVPPAPPGTRETDMGTRNPYTVFRPEGHIPWKGWRRLTDEFTARHPDRPVFFVAEAYSPGRPDRVLEYLGGDEFHQVFSFDLLLAQWNAAQIRAAIVDSMDNLAPHGVPLVWTLNNHDAQRCVTRYGRADATDVRHYTGNNLINSDAPVDLEVGMRRARAAALVELALPGAAYLYQGEELGLPEVLDIPDAARQDPIFIRTEGRELGRDGCRVPLPWSADASGSFGFSPSGAAQPWLPQPAGWGRWAVDVEDADPDSTLGLYRAAVQNRRELFVGASSAGPGDFEFLDTLITGTSELLAFRHRHVTVVLNCSSQPIPLPATLTNGKRLVISSVAGHLDPAVLPADAAVWLS
jgi:alpha-glucosidase